MKAIRPGLILFFVQLVLVLSVAGKYLYERETRPRVWAPTAPFDPGLPLRGRYLALRPQVDVCSLPREAARKLPQYYRGPISLQWNVSLSARDGKLLPAVDPHSRETVTLMNGQPCDRAPLSTAGLLFVPETAQLPLPLKSGQELWVELTLPAKGPPRPLQIAIKSADGFHPLKLN